MRRSLLATTFGLLAIAATAGAATVPARHAVAPGQVTTVRLHDHAESTKPKKTKTTTTKDPTATTAKDKDATAPTTTTTTKPHSKK